MIEDLCRQNGFSLDRLATLCRVARCGSITAAAREGARDSREVATRQTQFGRQIKELGEVFGVEFMDTSRRPHVITPEGRELARLTTHFLAGMEDYLAACQNRAGKLAVGAGESLIQWYLIPVLMPKLRSAFPGVPVIFKNRQTRHITESLLDGDLDLGLLRSNAAEAPLKTGASVSFCYRYFIPRAFRSGLEGSVSFRDIARYPMAVLEGGGEFRTQLEQGFREAGVTPNFQMECSSSTQIALAVSRREYAAVLPEIAREQLGEHVLDFPIDGVDLKRSLCFAWHPDRVETRPLLRQVVSLLTRSPAKKQG